VHKAIDAHVQSVNDKLASFERVKYWTLVDPFSIGNGLLTASLKVKRNIVHEVHAESIASMYASDARPSATVRP
ncbi:MAG: hypothetical protein JNK45_35410, partial [Myxococcales bacterium]|nr:hypothetical protein [Myxococcales bacterium]